MALPADHVPVVLREEDDGGYRSPFVEADEPRVKDFNGRPITSFDDIAERTPLQPLSVSQPSGRLPSARERMDADAAIREIRQNKAHGYWDTGLPWEQRKLVLADFARLTAIAAGTPGSVEGAELDLDALPERVSDFLRQAEVVPENVVTSQDAWAELAREQVWNAPLRDDAVARGAAQGVAVQPILNRLAEIDFVEQGKVWEKEAGERELVRRHGAQDALRLQESALAALKHVSAEQRAWLEGRFGNHPDAVELVAKFWDTRRPVKK
jgi:hypothetical protein